MFSHLCNSSRFLLYSNRRAKDSLTLRSTDWTSAPPSSLSEELSLNRCRAIARAVGWYCYCKSLGVYAHRTVDLRRLASAKKKSCTALRCLAGSPFSPSPRARKAAIDVDACLRPQFMRVILVYGHTTTSHFIHLDVCSNRSKDFYTLNSLKMSSNTYVNSVSQ